VSPSAFATRVSNTARPTFPPGSFSPSPSATGTRAPAYSVPAIIEFGSQWGGPDNRLLIASSLGYDTTTRTGLYPSLVAGACSKAGADFYLAAPGQGALWWTLRAAGGGEAVVGAAGGGGGGWAAGAGPAACRVHGDALYVGVRAADGGGAEVYASTPALPTAATAGSVTWTLLLDLRWAGDGLGGGASLAAMQLTPSGAAIFLAVTGRGVYRCGRDAGARLNPFSGCALNARDAHVKDVMLSQSELRLYTLNNASVGALGLGGGEGDGTFAGAPLYTLLPPASDGRTYLALGLASNLVPTMMATASPLPTRSFSPTPTACGTDTAPGSRSGSGTPSPLRSPTPSAPSPSPPATGLHTASTRATGAITASGSLSLSPAGGTRTGSKSQPPPTRTICNTATGSPSPSREPTGTPSESPSPLPSRSESRSDSTSPSPRRSATTSGSARRDTPSPLPSRSSTASPRGTGSPRLSRTVTGSPRISLSPSSTASAEPSERASASPRASNSASASAPTTSSASATTSASPCHSASGSPSASPSATGSPDASLSPSGSPSPTPSASGSPSDSGSVSSTASAAASFSASASSSVTHSASFSSEATGTVSASGSGSFSASPTGSPSITGSSSGSPLPSLSASVSASISNPLPTATATGEIVTVTPTPSFTDSGSPSDSASVSSSASASVSVWNSTASASGSPSATASVWNSTASETGTPSPSASSSLSTSPSPRRSLTGSRTGRASPSLARTLSASPSIARARTVTTSPTHTRSPNATRSASAAGSATRSVNATRSPTGSPSVSGSPSVTDSSSGWSSSSPSASVSGTLCPTSSHSACASASFTASGATLSARSSATFTPTACFSGSRTGSLSRSGSAFGTASGSPSITRSTSGSPSASPHASATWTPSVCESATPSTCATVSASGTETRCRSGTPSAWVNATGSASVSHSGSATPSLSGSGSISASPSPSLRNATTPSPTGSGTTTRAITQTPAPTVNASGSAWATPSASSSTSPSPSASPWFPFAAGDLVALQIGDGATVLNKGLMAPVMLLSFSTSLPPGGAGALPPNRTILVPGVTLPDNSAAYGALAPSYDGSLVVFAAYAAAVGAAADSAVRGLRAIVAVNRYGFAAVRYVSGPGALPIFAAATCDNAKFFFSTAAGVYSSASAGAAPVFEGPAASLVAYALRCGGPSAAALRIYGGASSQPGALSFAATPPAGAAGTLASLAAATTPAAAPTSNLRGFAIVGYDGAGLERAWLADSAAGVLFSNFTGAGAGAGFYASTPALPPGAGAVFGVAANGTGPGVVWASAGPAGVFALNRGAPPTCTNAGGPPCAWLNGGGPVLRPLGWGTGAVASLRGLAPVPGSAATAAAPRPFSASSLLLLRVGDGVAALSAAPASAPVFLEEYAGGVLVQAVALTGGALPAAFRMQGTGLAAPEGLLSRSPNGLFVAFGGRNAATGAALLARVINAGVVDGSTAAWPTGPAAPVTGVASVAVNNAGDTLWVCRQVAGATWQVVGVPFAGNASAALPAALVPACAYVAFDGAARADSALWVAAPGAPGISNATAVSATALGGALSSPWAGSPAAPRQLAFLNATAALAAASGVGVLYYARRANGLWAQDAAVGALVPCAAMAVPPTCTAPDAAVVGLAFAPAAATVYVTTTTALYALALPPGGGAPVGVNFFRPLVPPRANMELRGIALAPAPVAPLVYPAKTSFSERSLLLLRSDAPGAGGATAAALALDEVDVAAATTLQSWGIPSTAPGARAVLPPAAGLHGALTASASGEHALLAGYDAAVGEAVPVAARTIVRVSCRGTVAFSAAPSGAADAAAGVGAATGYGVPGAAGLLASAGNLSVVDFGGGAAPLVPSPACAGGWGGAVVLRGAAALASYALGRGCGVYAAPGAPSPASAFSRLAALPVDASAATGGFAVVPAGAGADGGVEFWYVAPATGEAVSAFLGGGAGGSRGSVAPPAPAGAVIAVSGLPAGGSAPNGTVLALTAGEAYACRPLACGPGATTVVLPSAGTFRLAPGGGTANAQACVITAALPVGYRAGVSYAAWALGAGDTVAVTDGETGATLTAATNAQPAGVVASSRSLSVRFASDASGTGAGVVGTLAALPLTCGDGSGAGFAMAAAALTATLAPGATLRTQVASQPAYAAAQRCDWAVHSGSANALTLTFSSRALAAGDVFTVYEANRAAANASMTVLGRFTSAVGLPASLSSTGNWLYATFSSDASRATVAAGVVATVSSYAYSAPALKFYDGGNFGALRTLSAGTTPVAALTAAPAILRTDVFAGIGASYASSYLFTALITAPVGYVVRFRATFFSTESGWDFFNIYDGPDTTSLVAAARCVAPLTPSRSGIISTASLTPTTGFCTTTGRNMFVRFTSDYCCAPTAPNGVVGQVTFLLTATTPVSSMACVPGVPTTIGGANGGWEVGVPHYTRTTNAASNLCVVTYTAPVGAIVKLEVVSWAVRAGDGLAVYDGPNATTFPTLIEKTSVAPEGGAMLSSGASLTLVYTAGLTPLAGVLLKATAVAVADVFAGQFVCSRLVSSAAIALPASGAAVTLRTNPSHNYGSEAGCAFTVTAPSPTSVVRLAFSAFTTETGADIFTVFDGPSPAFPILAALSGSSVPANITSSANTMHITFTTDAARTFSGVVATAAAVTPPLVACAAAGASTAAVGSRAQLRSNTAATYAAGVACTLRLGGVAGKAVALSYQSLALSGAGDSWAVFDGPSAASPLLTSSAGPSATPPRTVTSTGKWLTVVFASAGAGGAGVVADVSLFAASSCALVAKAASGAYYGVAPAPRGCGVNDRRLAGEEEAPPLLRGGCAAGDDACVPPRVMLAVEGGK
jgi:hypothetical protein